MNIWLLKKIYPAILICLLSVLEVKAEGLVSLETDTGFRSVYVYQDPDAVDVMVSVTILAGEVDVTGPEGLSHYLEHLMFWHADRVNDEPFHSRGGNAWVDGIITNYYNIAEDSELKDMLDFAARLFTVPELEPQFMSDERKIVTREYDLRYLNNPEAKAFQLLKKRLYGDSPVGRSTIGTPQSIASLTVPQALEFHQRYYHPANAVLFVTGNVEPENIKALINQKFNSIPTGKVNEADWRLLAVTEKDDYVIDAGVADFNHHRLLYGSLSHWSADKDPMQDVYTARLLQAVLTSALPGSLAIPMRIDNFIVSDFDLYLSELVSDHFELYFNARADRGVTWQVVSDELRSALIEIASVGIPEKTVERVRKRMLQTERRSAKNALDVWYRSQQYLRFGLPPNSLDDHLQRIESVTIDDINSLLKALAAPTRRATAYILPMEK